LKSAQKSHGSFDLRSVTQNKEFEIEETGEAIKNKDIKSLGLR